MSLELFDLNGKITLITGSSRVNEAVKTLSESDYVNGHILYIDGGMLSCV